MTARSVPVGGVTGARGATGEPAVRPVSLARHRFRRRWTAAVVAGELVGFLPPALIGALLVALGAGDPALVIGLTVAGAFEGLALGVTQSVVLAERWPALWRRGWIGATAAAASFAWLVGMGGSALAGGGTVPVAAVVAALVPLSLLALLSMGFLQWLVLRRVVARSGRWVPVTAVAWLAGVPVPVVALSVIPEGWPAVAHVVVAVLAAVVMGLIVGTITGRTLERLAVPAPSAPSDRAGGPVADDRDHGLVPDRVRLALVFAWTALSCFVVVSVVVGLAALPATAFYRWHLALDLSPWPLRLFLLAAAALPAYGIFALLFMLLTADAARLLGWRPPRRAELPIAELPLELRHWARYAILSHLVHVVAGPLFRSTPVWIWYLRRNGARIGRHVWINSLQVGDDCLLELGDEVVVGAGAHLSGHTVEGGRVLLAPITLGAGTTVGVGAHVGIGVRTGEGTQIGAMSLVPKHATLDAHTTYIGIPARPVAPEA